MREANDRGYECLLVEDGTESYFPEFKQATLEMVRAQGGIVGWTATTDQVLAALADLNFRPVAVVSRRFGPHERGLRRTARLMEKTSPDRLRTRMLGNASAHILSNHRTIGFAVHSQTCLHLKWRY